MDEKKATAEQHLCNGITALSWQQPTQGRVWREAAAAVWWGQQKDCKQGEGVSKHAGDNSLFTLLSMKGDTNSEALS